MGPTGCLWPLHSHAGPAVVQAVWGSLSVRTVALLSPSLIAEGCRSHPLLPQASLRWLPSLHHIPCVPPSSGFFPAAHQSLQRRENLPLTPHSPPGTTLLLSSPWSRRFQKKRAVSLDCFCPLRPTARSLLKSPCRQIQRPAQSSAPLS